MRVVEGQGGIVPTECRSLRLPDGIDYLWHWFLHLRNRSQQSGMGAGPISEADYGWWQVNHAIRLTPFERHVIDALDNQYLLAQAKQG